MSKIKKGEKKYFWGANLDAGLMKLVPKFLMPGKVALRFARPPLPVVRP